MGDLARRYSSSGIEYRWRQQPEVRRETFQRNANQITELLICNWDDAGDLKADIMESATYDKTKKYLKRNLPMLHPDTDTLYLTSMVSQKSFLKPDPNSVEGKPQFNPETGLWSYQRIEYVCTFTNLPYVLKSDDKVKDLPVPELERYTVVTPSPIASNRILSSQSINVEAGGGVFTPIGQTAAIPEIVTRYQFKLFQWPKEAIPWSIIYDRMGKVNDADFLIQSVNNPTESLLYEGLGSTPEEYTGPDGKKYVDITHVLTRHPVNWNKAYYNGEWRYLRVGTAEPPVRRYQKAAFNNIFIPKQSA